MDGINTLAQSAKISDLFVDESKQKDKEMTFV